MSETDRSHLVERRFRRGRTLHRWSLAVVVGMAVPTFLVVAVASLVPLSSETARLRVIEVLAERLDAEVDLQELDVTLLPSLHAEGRGLTVRHKGRRDVAPLISITHFVADGTLVGLLRRHVTRLAVEGLDIEIPPDRNRDALAQEPADGTEPTSAAERSPAHPDAAWTFVIDEMVSTDARLAIIPAEADKDPKVWAIHHLRMMSVSPDHPMPFRATLTNAVPPGEIETEGTFGPWRSEEPGYTPLDGHFTFARADLSVFKGISGLLSARGRFGGVLVHLDINGQTDTPQFAVTAAGHPVPLHASYRATVDGTNGNTTLEKVDASFLKSALMATGDIVGKPGQDGRTVTLDIVMDHARLEDVMQLAVRTPMPPMTGALQLKTTFVLPPGDRDVVQKMRLNGRFTIAGTQFANLDVQTKINELSHRSRGKAPNERTQRVGSHFMGTFRLDGGRLTIPQVTFDVPGSAVRLAGRYDLVPETLDFTGTLFMDAKLSQTTSGYKSLLLKIVDPLFKRDGGGSAIPIRIRGTASDPSLGLDKGRLFTRK